MFWLSVPCMADLLIFHLFINGIKWDEVELSIVTNVTIDKFIWHCESLKHLYTILPFQNRRVCESAKSEGELNFLVTLFLTRLATVFTGSKRNPLEAYK